jgi:hypothetical protein
VRRVQLICAAADEAGLPDDPEFRSAFVAYCRVGEAAGACQLPAGRAGAARGAGAALGLGRGAAVHRLSVP